MSLITVLQGECKISSREGVVLNTVLGSCIAVCLHDPVRRAGGMNHFLLPGDGRSCNADMRYGYYSMELLINELLKIGAQKNRLTAKLFGGASVIKANTNIGSENFKFARDFISREGIQCLHVDVGGNQARRLRFEAASGETSSAPLSDCTYVSTAPSSVARRNRACEITLF